MDNFCSIESLSHDTKIFYMKNFRPKQSKNDIVNGVENYINGYKNNHIKDTYSYHLPYNYCNINDINRFKSIVEIELKKGILSSIIFVVVEKVSWFLLYNTILKVKIYIIINGL